MPNEYINLKTYSDFIDKKTTAAIIFDAEGFRKEVILWIKELRKETVDTVQIAKLYNLYLEKYTYDEFKYIHRIIGASTIEMLKLIFEIKESELKEGDNIDTFKS